MLPPHVVGGMITSMDGDPTDRTTPDLFSTGAVKGGSSTPPTKSPAAKATTETAPPRHVLPKNHAATLEELKRRGKTPQGIETDLQTLRHRFEVRPDLKKQPFLASKRRHVDVAEAPRLTQGKLNAVRGAFKAGVTPSRITKQFGISQSDVKKALASDEKKR
jgi:hypothetical protein